MRRNASTVVVLPGPAPAGPLAALAASWQAMWDVSRGLDEVIEAARTFYPGRLAEGTVAGR